MNNTTTNPSAQVRKALAARGIEPPVIATGQAARQLQKRFGIQPATETVDAAEVAELRAKAEKHDALEAALLVDPSYTEALGEFDQGEHTVTTTEREQ